MAIEVIDGNPVYIGRGGRPGKNHRVRPLPRKTADKPFRKINKQQKKAIKGLLEAHKEGKDITKASVKKEIGLNSGYSEGYAVQAVDKAMQRKPVVSALEKVGVDDDFIAKTIKEGMTEPRHPKNPDMKDYHAIDKFVKEANRLKDNYPATKIQSEQKVVHIHLSGEDFQAVERFKRIRGREDETE